MLFSSLLGASTPYRQRPIEDCAAASETPISIGTPHQSFPSPPSHAPEWDTIVLGAGTAGACLANRLSSDPSKRILVLERGTFVLDAISRSNFFATVRLHMGGFSTKIETLPQPGIGQRKATVWVGKLVGGGSAVNCCIYTRPGFVEFDNWDLPGWSGQELEPYFDRSERHHPLPGRDNVAGHGYDGPWETRAMKPMYGFAEHFMSSMNKLGVKRVDDPHHAEPRGARQGGTNGPRSTVAFPIQLSQMLDGSRHHTGRAYLSDDIVARPNLHVATSVTIDHVALERTKDGLVVKGVWFLHNKRYFFAKSSQVVLSSGAIFTPVILQRSGIGAAPLLKQLDVQVWKDVPAVGRMKDHIMCPLIFRVPAKDSLMKLFRPKSFFQTLIPGLWEYWRYGTGWIPTALTVEAVSFLKADDIQLEVGKGMNSVRLVFPSSKDDERSRLPDCEISMEGMWPSPAQTMYYGLGGNYGVAGMLVYLTKPKSTGTVSINSLDPETSPEIDHRLLEHPEDRARLIKGVRFALAVAAEMRHGQGYDISPASVPGWDDKQGGWRDIPLLPPSPFSKQTDKERAWDFADPAAIPEKIIIEYIQSVTDSALHMASTAAMGAKDDATRTVVNSSSLEVFGTKGLHVMDNSVMPDVLAVHPQASIVAMAEKAAEIIAQA